MLQLDELRDGPVASEKAPIPEDPDERARHLKAAAYFLDASMVGICNIPAESRLATPVKNEGLVTPHTGANDPSESTRFDDVFDLVGAQIGRTFGSLELSSPNHEFAIAILVEFPRDPDINEPGGEWLVGAQPHRAAIRSNEVGVVIAQYLRILGYSACVHSATTSELNLDELLVAAGLATPGKHDAANNPFVADRFGVAVVSTELELATDEMLDAQQARIAKGFRWWFGFDGARSRRTWPRYKKRPYHMGSYPMESIRRRETTTTRINGDEVPRIPKRHDMFMRADAGELGRKAQDQMKAGRCVTKFPFANAMIPLMSSTIPLQEGETAVNVLDDLDDPVANSKAIKAALYFLGADFVGISEAPDYVWYSHQTDGTPIVPYHKYAITVLVDQGQQTMAGSSGDDWVSAAQSMRAYMRSNLLCSMVAAHLRRLGFDARSHGNPHQDVLHIPLIMLAGLGELSRIGELVLNPFIGPRIKSAIITTDLPLSVDKPIDFGLQDFCQKCTKCARECPSFSIPFGDKITFNGYEMWKPDVEKCARYRINNPGGAMCGRCMKVCPYNFEGALGDSFYHWCALHVPFARRWLAEIDDKFGRGQINDRQKWWWDLDTDMTGRIVAAKRTNVRPLFFRAVDPQTQKLAAYPAEVARSQVDSESPAKLDRKLGMEWYERAKKAGNSNE